MAHVFSQPPQAVTAMISADEMNSLATNPVEIVPAPGEGKAVVPIVVYAKYNAGGNPNWTADGSDTQCYLGYAGATVTPLGVSVEDDGTLVLGPQMMGLSSSAEFVAPLSLPTSGAEVGAVENAAVVLTAATDGAGPITSAAVHSGGTDYAEDDDVAFGNGGLLRVTSVTSGGAVVAFDLTDSGAAKERVRDAIATSAATDSGAQQGSGVGLTVDVAGVQLGDGGAIVSLLYTTIDTTPR